MSKHRDNTVDDKTWRRVQVADVDRSMDLKKDAGRTEQYRRNAQNPRNS